MKGKVVFITGCSSGIGKALSEEFHTRGHRVIATARQLKSLESLGAKGIVTEQLDVTNADERERVVGLVLRREGRIDVLVNNAGYGLMGPVIDMPQDELLDQFQTNVFAPLMLIRQVAAGMRERGSGMIVNIGSISGVVTTPFAGPYCASKAALHAFSDALRMELAVFGIDVVTVQPGGIMSNFGRSSDATAERLLKPDSWYAPMRHAILSRTQVSQDGATPAVEFARRLVRVLEKDHAPPIVRLGKRSFTLPLVKRLFPTRMLDGILSKRFGLMQVRSRIGT